MKKMDEIETKVKEALEKFTAKARAASLDGPSEWTEGIKTALGKLGEKCGYSICTSGFSGRFEAEWLYDMVWYHEVGKKDQSRLVDIPLVAECEWNLSLGHIKYDFEKLLAANASHRLMICEADKSETKRIIEYFHDAIDKYKLCRKGDRFLIALLDAKGYTFRYELIIKQ